MELSLFLSLLETATEIERELKDAIETEYLR